MRRRRALPFLILLLVLAGCNLLSPPEPSATPPPPSDTPAPTVPVIPTVTDTPAPTATPSPTPFAPFEAHSMVDNANLRSGPGYLFQVSRMLNTGVTFQVLGKSTGGEWIFVRTAAGNEGWIFAQLIETDQDLQAAPEMQVEDALLITGKVVNAQGQPVSGIQFALTQLTNLVSLRTDAMTGPDGMFYAFLPTSTSGTWNVAYTAVSCKSNTMDASCNCLGGVCGAPDPLSQNVTLPQTQALTFTWK